MSRVNPSVSPEAGEAAARCGTRSPGTVPGDEHPLGTAPVSHAGVIPTPACPAGSPSPNAGHQCCSPTGDRGLKSCWEATAEGRGWALGKVYCRKEPGAGTDPNLGRYRCCCNVRVAPVLPRDPHAVRNWRLLLQGCLLGHRMKPQPHPKGFLRHSTAPSQRRRGARVCQPAARHRPATLPTRTAERHRAAPQQKGEN